MGFSEKQAKNWAAVQDYLKANPARPAVEPIAPIAVPLESAPWIAHSAGYFLRIDGWRPPSANEIYRGSLRRRMRLGRECDEMIAQAASLSGIPRAERKRACRIDVEIPPGSRAHDPDAFLKAIGDALKKAGMIVNDSQAWVEWRPTRQPRMDRLATVIYLEDVR